MSLIQLKAAVIAILLLAGIGITGLGYACYNKGYHEAQQSSTLLTPDSREFLHGYKLDLPEELTAMDTTYIMSVKDSVNKTIRQSITVVLTEYGVNDVLLFLHPDSTIIKKVYKLK